MFARCIARRRSMIRRGRGRQRRKPYPPRRPEEPIMIVEERIYTLYPNKAAVYIAHFEREGIAIQRPILGRLIGYFSTEVGALNQIVHLWGYESFEERTRRRANLAADPRWREYVVKNI